MRNLENQTRYLLRKFDNQNEKKNITKFLRLYVCFVKFIPRDCAETQLLLLLLFWCDMSTSSRKEEKKEKEKRRRKIES